MRYFSSREIYARLSSIYRKKMATIDEITIMRWCAEVMTEIIRDPENFFYIEDMALGKPKNGLISVPMNVIKVSSVKDKTTERNLTYRFVGNYIHLNSADFQTDIVINCYALPIDEDGFPLICEGFEKACEAYCAVNIYREDFMEGKIDVNRWVALEQEKESELNAAQFAWRDIDRNYVQDLMNIMVNQGYKKIINGKFTR